VTVCPACGRENADDFAFCPYCGSRRDRRADTASRKTVTVLFCDLVGSTNVADGRDAEAVDAILVSFFEAMRAVVEEHRGTIAKFIGDAVVAVFGLPVVLEDDALRAVKAALHMQRTLASFASGSAVDVALRARIGIHTGEVLASATAPGDSLALGDTMNVAARLEQAAPANAVLISAATYALVRHAVVAEPAGAMELKGKTRRVEAYSITSLDERAPSLARAFETPFVARIDEMKLLTSALRDVTTLRRPRSLTVIGESGVGKSRLVDEFASLCDAETVWLRCRCTPYGQQTPFRPMLDVVRSVTGLGDNDGERAVARIAELMGGPASSQDATYVARAIGLTHGTVGDAAAFPAMRRLLESFAAGGTLVLFVDDVHWADTAFLELLQTIAPNSDKAILLLCTSRPELLDAVSAWRDSSEIVELVSLDAGASALLVDELVHGRALPVATRHEIVTATGGNPLFIEHMLAMVLDESADHAGIRADAPLGGDLPPTINAVLSARIDALPESERMVLEAASVLGMLLEPDRLADVLGGDADESVLASLVRRGMVLRDGDDGARIGFRHRLLRDAVYAAIPKARRVALHQRAAEALERVEGPSGEAEERIAYHQEQAFRLAADIGRAGEREIELAARAAVVLRAAAERADAMFRIDESFALMRRVVDLFPDPTPDRAEALIALSDTTWVSDRSVAWLDEASRVAREAREESLALRAEVRLRFQRLALAGTSAQSVLDALTPFVDQLSERRDDEGLAYLHRVLMLHEGILGHQAKALELRGRAIEHARRAGHRLLELEALRQIPAVIGAPRPLSEARAEMEALFDELPPGDLQINTNGRMTLAFIALAQGDAHAGGSYQREAERYRSEVVDRRVRAHVDTTSLTVLFIRGDADTAERTLRMLVRTYEDVGNRSAASYCRARLAPLLFERGARIRDVEIPDPVDEDFVETLAWIHLANAGAATSRGNPIEGRRDVEAAVTTIEETDDIDARIAILESGSILLRRAQAYREALDVCRRGLELARFRENVVAVDRLSKTMGTLPVDV
jgi:class 3 adenylate cyclase/tetratricopeptide (TPR) repeat protein